MKEALSIIESFEAHESLARAYEADGEDQLAITEYRWLIEHRGRALAECPVECGIMGRLIDWNMAHFRIARLFERTGQTDEAKLYYQSFLNRWQGGDDLPAKQEAQHRLAELGAP